MLVYWKNWCRLCAKIDSSDGDSKSINDETKSISDQLAIIYKHFSISPKPHDGILSICNVCSSFLVKIENFKNRCQQADQMFKELIQLEKIKKLDLSDIDTIRSKYGFEHEEINQESSYDNLTLGDIHSDPLELESEIRESVVLEAPDGEPENTQKRQDQAKEAIVSSKEIKEELPNENIVFDDKHSDALESVIKIEEPTVVKLETPNVEPEQTQKKRNRPNKKKEDVTEKDSAEDDDEPLIKHKKPRKKKRYIKKIKKPKNTFCEICSKKFCSASYLKKHMLAKHCEEESPYVCSKCQKHFTSKSNLNAHMKTHLPDEERFIHPCQYCGKKFSSKNRAEIHMNAVHNRIGKTFVCEECGKSFTTRTGLKQHIDTHITVKNLKCPSCPKMFNNRHRLNQHRIFHRDAVHPCPHCDAKFRTKMGLKHHLLIHSDVKQYKCNYCEKEFNYSKDLKHHLFLHTGDKPYKCQFCEKTFRDSSAIRNHEKKIHPVEFAAWAASGIPRKETKLPKLGYLLSKSIPFQ